MALVTSPTALLSARHSRRLRSFATLGLKCVGQQMRKVAAGQAQASAIGSLSLATLEPLAARDARGRAQVQP